MDGSKIKIRFNTEKLTDPNCPPWRVIINGVERLAEEVRMEVPSFTSEDEIAPGLIKWHVNCVGIPVWIESRYCIIQSAPSTALGVTGGDLITATSVGR